MTRVFTEDGVSIPGDGDRSRAESRHQVKTAPTGLLQRRPGDCGEKPQPRWSPSRSPGTTPRPGRRPGRGLWEFRLADDARPRNLRSAANSRWTVQGRPGGRCDRHHHRQGLRRARSSAMELHACRMRPTVTRCRIAPRVPSVSARRRDACSRARKCPATWASSARPSQNLEGGAVDVERNLLLIRGAVPGAPGGDVIVRPAAKAAK
jgi:large subunit ribosomal protein L3